MLTLIPRALFKYSEQWPTKCLPSWKGVSKLTFASLGFEQRNDQSRGSNVLLQDRVRLFGSNSSPVDKGSAGKEVDLPYSEQKVTVYSCEDLYKKWRDVKKFRQIPSSGVYADIMYIDTSIRSGVENSATSSTPIVLCIHGIPGNYGVFSHLITEFGDKGIRVIVPNFPASIYLRGKDKEELFRHTVDEKVQIYKDFLKSLDITELDAVVSHSSAIYPALKLALDPDLNVKCQVWFNTGGHKETVTMRPYWIIWVWSHLYMMPIGRKFIQKTWKFMLNCVMRTPLKDDDLEGIMLLAITMVFSDFWKAKEQFKEVARRKLPTLLCFSENDKVVEKELTYEVISLLGASRENISYYDKNAQLIKNGENGNSWLTLASFEAGSHYVFRKHPEICNRKVLELFSKAKIVPEGKIS